MMSALTEVLIWRQKKSDSVVCAPVFCLQAQAASTVCSVWCMRWQLQSAGMESQYICKKKQKKTLTCHEQQQKKEEKEQGETNTDL